MKSKSNPKKIEKELSALDWSIVHYKLKQDDYSKKQIMAMQKEFFRYLALCSTVEAPLAPSEEVDEVWHNAILCTKQYAGPVAKICGGFIHHNPNDGTKTARAKDGEAFWNTIEEYEKVWGEPNLKVWGIKKRRNLNEC